MITIEDLKVYGVIYKIENLINQKVYIGQTTIGIDKRYRYKGVGIERIYSYHKSLRNKNKHYNKHLLSSIEKYGVENFKTTYIFDYALDKDELDIKEKKYIELYQSTNRLYGYNKDSGGANGIPSYETRKKQSLAKIGIKRTQKEKENLSKLWSGENNPKAKKVICVTTNEIFNTAKEGALKYGVKDKSSIGRCCRGQRNFCGTFNGEKLVWKFYDDFVKL